MRILLGVGGGIAAYKAAQLARALMERGAAVETVMTRSAREFIQPLTFASLTGNKVITDLFASGSSDQDTLSSAIEHIRAARDNELLLVAPCTADLLAKFAHGLADDFLSTTYLAFTGKVVLAPAMNVNMWNHPAVQANLATLRQRAGHIIVDPDAGYLACGMTGPGRLADPKHIADVAVQALRRREDLTGETVLISAGPTQEPLDPVRFISNRSSGKMGYALADAARARGARVILVSGPVHLPPPAGVEMVRVRTAVEMRDAIIGRLPESTIIIKSAAVADYHVANVPAQKVKKTAAKVSIDLDPTPDILAECGRIKGDRILIGFAAETQNMMQEARRKMEVKNCDMVVGNLVSQEGIGFESDNNAVTLILRSGEVEKIAEAPKREIADRILDQITKLRLAAAVHE
ncbi:MAG: bifunctional phosphopantothenoylcysteine decarboxylase/phosphopantothenate--cysteine ligase CoaBC [Acidobacteria bacterium]|nr:bifunctional phosphopantothenoylcysteine decarboxylase/phosphopantothenate--cysteine ligase CoaBC [Acidobacteriota bacterium]